MVEVARDGHTTQLVPAAKVRAGDEIQVAEDDGGTRRELVREVEVRAGLVRVAFAGGGEATLEASRAVLVTFAGGVPR